MDSITIAPRIEWADGQPNLEARQWINDNVLTTEPRRDRYGRPESWTVETETAVVNVTREYIRPGAWAKRRDIITVTSKSESI